MQLPIKENIVFKFTDVKQKQTKDINSNCNNPLSQNEKKQSKLLSSIKESNALSDQNNPIIQQIVFFSKMFENFLNSDSKKTKEELEIDFNTKISANQIFTDFNTNNLNEKKEFIHKENLKELIFHKFKSEKNKNCQKNEKKNCYQKNEKKNLKKIMTLIIFLQVRKIEMKLNYFREFEKILNGEFQQNKINESQIIQDRIKLAMKQIEVKESGKKFLEIIEKFEKKFNDNDVNININDNDYEKNLGLNEEEEINVNDNVNDNFAHPFSAPVIFPPPSEEISESIVEDINKVSGNVERNSDCEMVIEDNVNNNDDVNNDKDTIRLSQEK